MIEKICIHNNLEFIMQSALQVDGYAVNVYALIFYTYPMHFYIGTSAISKLSILTLL